MSDWEKNFRWNLDNEWNRLWGNIAEVRSQRYHKKTNSINLPEITGTQKTNLRIRKIPWVWPKPSAYMFVCIRCYICYSLLCNLGLSLTHLPDTGILVLQLVWLGPSLVWGDLASLTALLEKWKQWTVLCQDCSPGLENVCQMSYLSLQPNVGLNSAWRP